MRTVEVEELEKHIRELLQQVQESGEAVEVVNSQGAIARLVPIPEAESKSRNDSNAGWISLDDLRAEISKHWPKGVSAVEAVRDVRREL